MAPVTQVGLVLLTTASVALASRGHQARGQRHGHKRSQPYVRAPQAPYGYGNGTTSYSVGPTGTAPASSSTPDITETLTQTLTSTITNYITEEPTGASETGGYGTVSGASEPTCGGSVYVTVTDTVTVTAGAESSTPVAYSSTPAAYSSTPAASSSAAATTSAPAATLSPTSPAGGYQAPPSSSSSTSEYVAPASTSTPAAYSPPAYSAPSYSAPSASSSSTTSSAYSAPTGSSSTGLRTKRGCLYISGNDAACSALGDNTISWATNWGASANGGAGGNTYIPQLWGHTASNGFDYTLSWAADAAAAILAGAPAIMGYNEPDLASQANLSPAAGAALWHLVTAFESKVTVVSPSVTSRQQGTSFPGLDWLSDFKTAGADWHATGVHFYGDCTAEPSSQITYLQNMVNEAHSRFGKPVWVTEFGCNDGASTDQVAAFLKVALPYLEGESKCAQYAFFNAGLLVSGSAPNAAGNVYMSIASS